MQVTPTGQRRSLAIWDGFFFLLMLLTSDAGRQALNSNYEQVMVFLFSELQALGSRRAHCREGQAAHSQGTGPSNFKVYRIS